MEEQPIGYWQHSDFPGVPYFGSLLVKFSDGQYGWWNPNGTGPFFGAIVNGEKAAWLVIGARLLVPEPATCAHLWPHPAYITEEITLEEVFADEEPKCKWGTDEVIAVPDIIPEFIDAKKYTAPIEEQETLAGNRVIIEAQRKLRTLPICTATGEFVSLAYNCKDNKVIACFNCEHCNPSD
jgi:hypothetical protein